MKWYEKIKLDRGEVYSRKSLVAILQREKPSLSTNSYRYAISGMLHDGIISKKAMIRIRCQTKLSCLNTILIIPIFQMSLSAL